MGSVRLSNIRKSFGAVEVLHGIDVDVAEGEFVVLVGPSGCGKSTLLRALAGLEAISDGDIAINGKRVNDLLPKHRDIAMVFQNYALYPHMTVADNMGFALRMARVPADEKRRKVEQAAAILGLEDLLGRYPRQLSGGQRQRVAMGRAIVRDPAVFLFDEPLSNLDAKLRVQMRTEIKELHQRLSTTVIYVTHDQIEAMTMADKIVVMRDGRVEQIGTPLELYDRPANEFVAGFIGSPSMNFLAAQREPDGTARLGGGGTLSLPGNSSAPGAQISVGIRPEDVTLSNDPDGIEGRVVVVEPTGAETLVFVDVGGQVLTVSTRERTDARPGDRVRIAAPVDKLHVFDAASGASLQGR